MKEMINSIALLILGIALTSLSFPAGSLWFGILGWICLVPIIYLNEKYHGLTGVLINFIYFFASFAAILWINPFVEALRFEEIKIKLLLFTFYVLMPLLFTVLLVCSKQIAAKLPLFFKPFIYAGFWTSFEYLLTIIPTGFPLSIAVTQAGCPPVIQSASFLGIYGVSFLLMFVNSSLAISFLKRNAAPALIALLFFSINIIYGQARISLAKPLEHPIKIGLVQPNTAWEKSLYSRNNFFLNISLNQLYDLSKSIKDRWAPALIVWPELSADCYLLQNYPDRIASFARELKTPLLLGTLFYEPVTKKSSNIAALISDSGLAIGMHKKELLFPFIETGDYQPGGGSQPLSFDRGIRNIGAMLCFESLSPYISKKLCRNGADLLFLLSNDAWFGDSRWPWLHMNMLVLRAIENDRWAIHLNNTGPSAVVSPLGFTRQLFPYGQTGIAVASVASKENITFYAKSGELFPKAAAALSLGMILWSQCLKKGGGGRARGKKDPIIFGGEGKC